MSTALETIETAGFPVMVCRSPWDGIGTNVRMARRANEALRMAGMLWGTETEDAYFENGETELAVGLPFSVAPRCKLSVRNDLQVSDPKRILGIVGTKFVPVQNQEMLQFCDELVEDEGFTYERMGSIDGGRVVWAIVKVPYQCLTGADAMDQYLVLRNAHDGTSSFEIMFTSINRVGCNVMSLTRSGWPTKLRIQHTGKAVAAISAPHVVLGAAKACFDANEQLMWDLSQVGVDDSFFTEYLLSAFPDPSSGQLSPAAISARGRVHQIFDGIITSTGRIPTACSLWDATTRFIDHYLLNRNNEQCPHTTKMMSILWGTKAVRREKAGRILVRMAFP